MTDIAVHPLNPSVVYAISPYGGMFKSVDGGESWREINKGLPRHSVAALALDPQDVNVAYIGVSRNGVFKTLDGGTFWTRISSGLPEGTIQAMAVNPANPSVVFVGYREGWIYRTTNSGELWSQVFSGAVLLRIAPGDSNIVYASNGNELFRSTDGGSSWFQVAGAPVGIGSFAIDPRDSNRLLFATSWGILLTADGGSTWERKYLESVFDVEIHPANPDLVFTDRATSTDGGVTWAETIHTDPCLPTNMSPDPSNPAIVLGNSGYPFYARGICKSTDGGATWRQTNQGLNNTIVIHYALDPYHRGRMFVHTGQSNGLLSTKNSGNTWKDTGISGSFYGDAILVHPTVPNLVYAGGYDNAQVSGVWRSTDGGATFSIISSEVQPYWTLMADPFDAQALYCPTFEGVSKSVDGGFHWTPSQGIEGSVYDVVADPRTPGSLYAATDREGVMKSTDGGMHWFPVNHGLKDLGVGRVLLDSRNPDTLYAATPTGLFRTTNGGADWKLRAPGYFRPTLSPHDSRILYAGTPNGAYVSYDAGRTWRPMGLEGYSVYYMAIDPFDPNVLYAATFGNGIFRMRLDMPTPQLKR